MSENKFLVASDLDGTLLPDNKKIKLRTKLFVRKFVNEGNLFVVSTGRSPRSAINFQKDLGITGPIIMFNGNVIYDTSKENILIKEILWNKNKIKEIFKLLKDKKLIDGAYCETKKHLFYFNQNLFSFLQLKDEYTEIYEGEIDKILFEDTYNLVTHSPKNTLGTRKKIEDAIYSNFDDVIVEFWGSDSEDNLIASILHKGTNKSTAVEYISKISNVKKDHVITFGDSTNDIQMIENFEHGFAMKNCWSQVKSHTNNFTKKDNNHNGVVLEVKRLIKTIK